MKDILKRTEECAAVAGGEKLPLSAAAEYPAMFIYVGGKAAERISAVKAHLKGILSNGGSVLHAVFGSHSEDADITIDAELPGRRADGMSYTFSDGNRLSDFSAQVKKAADKLMTVSGFPQTNKCFLFVVTDPGSLYNALVPELVMIFSECTHIRVFSYLYAELDDNSGKLCEAAAFFRELSDCIDSGFSYDTAMMRGDQRIPIHKDGPVFDGIFLLEMYRSDMKYSPNNVSGNGRIESLTAALLDRADPIKLPRGMFLTAGLASVGKPADIISHVIFRSVTDILSGSGRNERAGILFARLIGYDAVAAVCDRVMTSLPSVGEIVSVMPKGAGKDPDSVNNTNVRSILDYYGGADKDHFDHFFRERCEVMTDNCGGINLSDIFREYINKGTLTLSDMLTYLGHDGAVAECMNEVTDRLGTEEEELKTDLENILSQPCSGLSHGLFSKPSGCEILAAAVSLKYAKELELLRVRMIKRLAADILAQAKELESRTAAALNRIKGFSDELSEEIFGEIYGSESTLTDVKAFTEHYSRVTEKAFGEFDRAGGMTALLKERELYGVFMACDQNGTGAFEEIAFAVYSKLLSDPTVRAAFAQSFDEELYARYKDFDGGKDPGWVDAQLVRRLSEVCRANLRYSVFQPSDCLYCIGNGESEFVRKMSGYEDPAFETYHIKGSGNEPYEQLAVYGVPSPESVVYINECNKVYEGACAERGDSFFIDRLVAAERTQ